MLHVEACVWWLTRVLKRLSSFCPFCRFKQHEVLQPQELNLHEFYEVIELRDVIVYDVTSSRLARSTRDQDGCWQLEQRALPRWRWQFCVAVRVNAINAIERVWSKLLGWKLEQVEHLPAPQFCGFSPWTVFLEEMPMAVCQTNVSPMCVILICLRSWWDVVSLWTTRCANACVDVHPTDRTVWSPDWRRHLAIG